MTRFSIYQTIRSLGYKNDTYMFSFDCSPEEIDIKEKFKDIFKKGLTEQEIDDGIILIQSNGILKAIVINDDIVENGLESIGWVYGTKSGILLLAMNYLPRVSNIDFKDSKFGIELERVYQQYIRGTKTRLKNLISEICSR